MKKFNQVITVEVSVDAIAEQLLSTISVDFKHRELLAENIIGSAMEQGTLSYVYSALNGYTNEINFAVGDAIICNEKVWQYVNLAEGDNNPKWEHKLAHIGEAIVKEVNLYKSDKLLVEYYTPDRYGIMQKQEKWVSHTACSKVVMPANSVPAENPVNGWTSIDNPHEVN